MAASSEPPSLSDPTSTDPAAAPSTADVIILQSSGETSSDSRSHLSHPRFNQEAVLCSLPPDLQQQVRHLLSLFENGREAELAKTGLVSFDQVWEALSQEASNRGGSSAFSVAQLSRQLLALVEDYNDKGASHIVPNDASYNFVLHAFAVSNGGLKAARSAEQLLREMVERCRGYYAASSSVAHPATSTVPYPTTKSFNIVINAWSKSREEDAGSQAERIFTWMEEWRLECIDHNNMFPPTVPSVRSVSGVMDAWAQVGGFDAKDRAQAILDVVLERYMENKQERDGEATMQAAGSNSDMRTVIKPNVILFNSLIHAHTKSRFEDGDSSTEAAEKAENILKRLEDLHASGDIDPIDENDPDDIGLAPNTRTFSLILHAWANVRPKDSSIQNYALEKAEDVLRRMMKLYETAGYDVKPNVHSFSSMILASARLQTEEGYRKAKELVETMKKLYQQTHDDDLKPNPYIVNALIKSATKVSPEEAERVLKEMLLLSSSSDGDNDYDGCVDTTSFNLVINAYAENGSMKAALDVVGIMETDGRIKPDAFTYNTILKAMSKSSSGGHYGIEAEEILDKMERLYEAGDAQMKPTVLTYTSVISVWGKSMYQGRVRKSKAILDRLVGRYHQTSDRQLKPDVVAFTSFISTCSNYRPLGQMAGERRAVFKMAVGAFDMMKEYDIPNQLTFFAMMKTAENLAQSREERVRFTEALFQRAITAGQVSKVVLQAFQRNVPRQVQQQYQVHNGIQSEVPHEWCANVRKAERPLVAGEGRR